MKKKIAEFSGDCHYYFIKKSQYMYVTERTSYILFFLQSTVQNIFVIGNTKTSAPKIFQKTCPRNSFSWQYRHCDVNGVRVPYQLSRVINLRNPVNNRGNASLRRDLILSSRGSTASKNQKEKV